MITMLAPEAILADDNSRFNLLETRLESLKEAILRDGQVNDPIEVEPLEEPVDGKTYRVTVGHYRHAAALDLNTKQNAGLFIPAVVRSRSDSKERLMRQVSENHERQNLTPMDSAVAIKAMLDQGISRMDIRRAFSRPNVKGKLEPCSNSFLNMMVSFLSLPKKAQNMLHLGTLPVRKAYELTTKPKDKWNDILAEAVEARDREFEFEGKLEQKFLEDERKAAEAEEKRKVAAETLAKEKALQDALIQELQRARESKVEAYKAATTATEDAEAKKKAAEALKAAEKAAEELERIYSKKVQEVKRLEEKTKSATDVAKEKAADLKKKRENAEKAKKNKPLDIEKAAKKVEGKTDIPHLRANEILVIVEQMSLPNGDAPKLQAIGKVLMAGFFCPVEGATMLLTPSQICAEIKKITGEYKEKKPVKNTEYTS
jgi:ParB/RepB/Spo0J family partition protein